MWNCKVATGNATDTFVFDYLLGRHQKLQLVRIRKFARPRQLMALLDLVPEERSSG